MEKCFTHLKYHCTSLFVSLRHLTRISFLCNLFNIFRKGLCANQLIFAALEKPFAQLCQYLSPWKDLLRNAVDIYRAGKAFYTFQSVFAVIRKFFCVNPLVLAALDRSKNGEVQTVFHFCL